MGKNDQKDLAFETLAIHCGSEPDPVTGASSPSIVQSTSFTFRDAQHAADAFALKEPAFIYGRINNPTVDALERKIAALEGGAGATCTSSGLSANLLAFSALLRPGDEFVSTNKMYGGTIGQFRDTFNRAFGWACHFCDPTRPDDFKKRINEKTRAIFIEALSNPEGVIADLEAFGKIADDAGIPLVVDNTVATPWLCQPFRYGASIVTHSTTKYMVGHGNAMGGAVVDGGTFPWKKHAARFPFLAGPTPSYNGLVFADAFPKAPLAVYNHAVGLRDLGLNQQPMSAYLTLIGIEDMPLRMQKHSENALAVAQFLSHHKAVKAVSYPGLPASPFHKLAKKYMREGMASSLFTFDLAGGHAAGMALVRNVKLFRHLANIGDTRSLIIHPASTTHAQLTDAQKLAAGCGPGVIRISIGIESADDLIRDLDQALGAAASMAA